ncbi:MAG: hypothetical protein JWN86_3091 [Planctomycetota bacterium]|nr:hypothetical protein [Planctomycetota bacterium]
MRIDQLDLIAFGPFTAATLDLSPGHHGLHVIHGPNEAGKSSALRALKQMLFGIKHQTADNFVHAHKDLRIGATLRHEDGSSITLIRRKALKKSLFLGLDDQQEVEEAVLSGKFLGNLAGDHFERMFTLDHASLSDGGKATLDAGGQFAEVLFGAGLHLPKLRAYQKSLEKQTDELFKPRGSNQKINQVLAQLGAAQEAIQAASIKGSDWTEKTNRLADLRREKERVDRDWAELDRERKRLDRIHKALPDLARRTRLRAGLDELKDAVRLPGDFTERRRQVEEDLRSAIRSRAEVQAELDRIGQALAALPPRGEILDEAGAIDALNVDLGGERTAAKARSKQARNRADHLIEARTHLLDLGRADDPETAEIPRLSANFKVKIRNLAEDGRVLRLDQETALRDIAKENRVIRETAAAIDALPSPRRSDALRRALAIVDASGDPTESMALAIKDCANIRRQLKALQAKLEGVPDEVEDAVRIPVPSAEEVEAFRQQIAELESDRDATRKHAAEIEDTLLDLVGRIDRRDRQEDLPREDDLRIARDRRETGWRLIQAAWRDQKPDATAIRSFLGDKADDDLGDAFEETLHRADHVADLLRHEAKRVTEKAHELADRDALAAKLAVARARRDEALARLEDANRRWAQLWAPSRIVPRTPLAMSSWLADHAKLVEKSRELGEKTDQIEAWSAKIDLGVAEIHREVVALGESVRPAETLAAARARAKAVVEAIQEEAAARRDLEKSSKDAESRRGDAESRRADADRSLRSWDISWAKAMEPLGLGADATDAQATATLDAIAKFLDAQEKARTIAEDIRLGEADAERFRVRVAAIAAKLAPNLADGDLEPVVTELGRLLQDARAEQTRRDELEKQHRDRSEALAVALAKIAGAQQTRDGLCREAGCSDADALPEIELRSKQRRALETELDAVQARLVPLASGASLDDFEIEAAAHDEDLLPSMIQTLEDEYLAKDADRQGLAAQIGGIQTELRGLQETAREARAEAAAAEREHLMGKLETDVDRYVHLRLASAVLRGAIEEFRKQNQAPVLACAGELFARLTLGRFRDLQVDLNDKDQPILVGIRPNGTTRVDVEGMSVGTVDQLFLALKLALLDHYLQTHQALPLVLDDLLIQFDDDRAKAALVALAEISKKTQVLFFTHHDHLIELAKSCVPPDDLFIQYLENGRS